MPKAKYVNDYEEVKVELIPTIPDPLSFQTYHPKPAAPNEKLLNDPHRKIRKFSPKMQTILNYDICGWPKVEIGKALNISMTSVYNYMSSPEYKDRREAAMKQMQDKVLEQRAVQAVHGDPVIQHLKENALMAAEEKVRLCKEGKSEFVRNSASSEILDRAGYKVESKKITTSVEVTEKMAERWDATLQRQRSRKITRTEETEES